MRELYVKYGYQEVVTPQIFDVELFKTSGHYQNYHDNMYFTTIDEREFGVKPMNCPGHFLMYGSQAFSYRDLPAALRGLRAPAPLREVRASRRASRASARSRRTTRTSSARIDQMAAEMNLFLDFIREVYETFAFREVKVGARDAAREVHGRRSRTGTRPRRRSSDAFEKRAETLPGWSYFVNAGDGAFYGPKLDFQVTDAIGRAWQLGTLQVDFSNPERFDLHYTAEDGSKKRPVVLHRAILGSLERFFGILIEHTGGDFPFWLAPEQVRVVPVSEKFNEYSEEILRRLREAGLRASSDQRNEKLGAKIRHGEMEKVPALLIVGEKEVAAGTVSLRVRHGGEFKDQKIEELLE